MTTNGKIDSSTQQKDHEHSSKDGPEEKEAVVHEETTHEAAERGHVATDQ